MARVDVILATQESHPEADVDDVPLAEELSAAGLSWRAAPWSAPVDWSEARVVLLRSTWDYTERHGEFLAWTSEVSRVARLLNPAQLVRWNSHKRYLFELAGAGVPVVPTVLVPAGSGAILDDVIAASGWDEAVVKPAISAGSWQTTRVGPGVTAGDRASFAALVAERDVLVQRYQAAVGTSGERCLVVLGGEVTHAVRKQPRFERDRDAFLAVETVTAAEDERALARDVLEQARATDAAYARVDMIRDEEGRLALMELEVIEPRLFLRKAPREAPRRLAAVVAEHVSRAPS